MAVPAVQLETLVSTDARWIVGQIDKHKCVPIYWLAGPRGTEDFEEFHIPVDLLEDAFRWIGAFDRGDRLNRVKLEGILIGFMSAGPRNPLPEAIPVGGQREQYPVGLPGLRLLENTRLAKDLKGAVVDMPACYSCGDSQDVELERVGGRWCFRCSGCGRAFHPSNPDVCGACEGSGKIPYVIGHGQVESHYGEAGCEVCGGAGR